MFWRLKMARKTKMVVIALLVVFCAYMLRNYVWANDNSGTPDVSGMLVQQSSPLTEGDTAVVELAALIYDARKEVGDPDLINSVDLNNLAQVRAQELSESFSHNRPNGDNYKTILDENGVKYNFSGENVAGGFTDAKSVLDAWMDNKSYRANILNPDYTQVGIGIYDANGICYWCALFVY